MVILMVVGIMVAIEEEISHVLLILMPGILNQGIFKLVPNLRPSTGVKVMPNKSESQPQKSTENPFISPWVLTKASVLSMAP